MRKLRGLTLPHSGIKHWPVLRPSGVIDDRLVISYMRLGIFGIASTEHRASLVGRRERGDGAFQHAHGVRADVSRLLRVLLDQVADVEHGHADK